MSLYRDLFWSYFFEGVGVPNQEDFRNAGRFSAFVWGMYGLYGLYVRNSASGPEKNSDFWQPLDRRSMTQQCGCVSG